MQALLKIRFIKAIELISSSALQCGQIAYILCFMTSVNVTELRRCLSEFLKPVQEGKAALNRIGPVKHMVISTTRSLSLPMKNCM